MSSLPKFAEISDNLSFLEDWEDRYRYLIELGQMLEPITQQERNQNNKVNGCVSQVWLVVDEIKNNSDIILHLRGDSDAMIVKGLVAVLIALYSDLTPNAIEKLDAIAIFDELNLREHLTSQRSNGLVAMVERIKQEAASRK